MGEVKSQKVPHSTTRSGEQVRWGPATIEMVWLHTELLLQESVARQVRVAVNTAGQLVLVRFVTVLTMTMFVIRPLQRSTAVGAVKTIVAPQSSTWLGAQLSTGGVVSTTVIVWLQ